MVIILVSHNRGTACDLFCSYIIKSWWYKENPFANEICVFISCVYRLIEKGLSSSLPFLSTANAARWICLRETNAVHSLTPLLEQNPASGRPCCSFFDSTIRTDPRLRFTKGNRQLFPYIMHSVFLQLQVLNPTYPSKNTLYWTPITDWKLYRIMPI
jgi:hypothetical protein